MNQPRLGELRLKLGQFQGNQQGLHISAYAQRSREMPLSEKCCIQGEKRILQRKIFFTSKCTLLDAGAPVERDRARMAGFTSDNPRAPFQVTHAAGCCFTLPSTLMCFLAMPYISKGRHKIFYTHCFKIRNLSSSSIYHILLYPKEEETEFEALVGNKTILTLYKF